jgi:hypothetical protein
MMTYTSSNTLLVLAGAAVFAGGCVLLSRLMYSSSNKVNKIACGFILADLMMLSGGWIVLYGLGLWS